MEGVSHHRGQLPATLHPQVLEAQAVPAQLLQADLLGASPPAPQGPGGCSGAVAAGKDGRGLAPRASPGGTAAPPRAGCTPSFLFIVFQNLIFLSNQLQFLLKMSPNDLTLTVKRSSQSGF